MTAQTMTPKSPLPASIHASPRALARATLGAAAAAAVILVAFVLPAEAGIDPTGIGKALGIAGMAQGSPEAETAAASAPAGTIAAGALPIPTRSAIERTGALRSDEMTIHLAPHSGQEIKAHMKAGDGFVFEWRAAGGPVKVDMHGEHPDAPDGEFTSYWAERSLESARGEFTAPFEGTHGWYWRNKGDTPVTITVRTTGFYKDLFKPAHD